MPGACGFSIGQYPSRMHNIVTLEAWAVLYRWDH
jgi:hypothetical protein